MVDCGSCKKRLFQAASYVITVPYKRLPSDLYTKRVMRWHFMLIRSNTPDIYNLGTLLYSYIERMYGHRFPYIISELEISYNCKDL